MHGLRRDAPAQAERLLRLLLVRLGALPADPSGAFWRSGSCFVLRMSARAQ